MKGFDDEEFVRTLKDMQEKSLRIEGRKQLNAARDRIVDVADHLDTIVIAPSGVMAAVDRHFVSTQTLLPSSMIRMQLRLAIHYVEAADQTGFASSMPRDPTLSSFVVLRTAIECTATAHWLMSAKNQRDTIERVLRRMWWDTSNAADMAETADGVRSTTGLVDLETRISEITRRIKGLEPAKIFESKRVHLSQMVADASAALRPNDPTIMRAGWMMCAGVAHGNVPVSAGAGINVASLQQPSRHVIDDAAFGFIFASTVEDIRAAVQLFEQRATKQHEVPSGES